LRSIVVIFLISVLTFPFWGTYTYFQVQQRKIRNEVTRKAEAGFEKTRLVLIKFTREKAENDLKWNDAREFEYKGQMYDIVQQTLHSDTIYYTCYKDHKETKLKESKDRMIAKAVGQDPSRKNQSEKLTDFFKTVFSQDFFTWNPHFLLTSVIHFSLFTIHYSLFTPAPLSPPPKYS
jgi:hypothetical protein